MAMRFTSSAFRAEPTPLARSRECSMVMGFSAGATKDTCCMRGACLSTHWTANGPCSKKRRINAAERPRIPSSATTPLRENRIRAEVMVRFMGLWDTVSSVGCVFGRVDQLDMAQNPIVRVGRHAVSIDERRAFYRDNLWGSAVEITDPEWPEELRAQGIRQDLAQVWFPGAHSDVGGSYPQWEAAPANEALRWMIGELQHNGAELCQDRIDMVLGKPSGTHSADKIYAPPPRPDHCIHESLKGLWLPLQIFPQQYYDKEDKLIQWRVPYGTPRTIPTDAISPWLGGNDGLRVLFQTTNRMIRKI